MIDATLLIFLLLIFLVDAHSAYKKRQKKKYTIRHFEDTERYRRGIY